MSHMIRPQGLNHLWGDRKALIGMVHLLPLPGAPRWGGAMDEVLSQALADADALVTGGMDGILVENFLDAPFFAEAVPPETVAAMAHVISSVVAASPLPVGVNVLRNDARAALGIAAATGAAFIRINVHTGVMWTDQGIVQGRAAETLRHRTCLGADVAILADVLVKHATPPPGLTPEQAASDAWTRGLADALVVTGAGTGQPTDLEELGRVRRGAPLARILVGSGVTPQNVAAVLSAADGAIVGTSLTKEDRAGSGVDLTKVRTLVAGRP